jgi:hypothetical protein
VTPPPACEVPMFIPAWIRRQRMWGPLLMLPLLAAAPPGTSTESAARDPDAFGRWFHSHGSHASTFAAEGDTCAEPEPPHKLVLCSPLRETLNPVIIPSEEAGPLNSLPPGLLLSWQQPPRAQTTYLSPLQAKVWSVPPGEIVPGVTISGTYTANLDLQRGRIDGVLDQRIEIAIVQIGTGQDSGVVGIDPVRVIWNSAYRNDCGRSRNETCSAEFLIDATTADQPLGFNIPDPEGGPPDSTTVPGIHIRFQSGIVLRRDWQAVFDVEDFEGWHVWRWSSDPTRPPVVVGSISKLSGVPRGGAWLANADLSVLGFLDEFVIDGNVYHYAVTTYDQGFDREDGGTLGSVPFDSPLPPATSPTEPGPTQLRIDFRRPPPPEFTPVQAVPNPYRESLCDPSDRASTCTVRFIHLPPKGILRIFTLAGDLVREFDIEAGVDDVGTLRWDTNNGAGASVASGVYIYQIVDLSSGQESFGRLAIIR